MFVVDRNFQNSNLYEKLNEEATVVETPQEVVINKPMICHILMSFLLGVVTTLQ